MKYPSPLIFIFLLLIIVPVLASTNTTINVTPVPTPAYNNTRVSQGQCIEVGGTYDVGGVMGVSFTTSELAFVYFGKYVSALNPNGDDSEILYKYPIPPGANAYTSFYLDPAIFGNRTGYWYQYDNMPLRAANKRAFYVSTQCIMPTSIPTIIPTTQVIHNETEQTLKDVVSVPLTVNPRYVADIVIARNDALKIENLTGTYQAWIFGRVTGIYGVHANLTNSTTIFTKDEVRGMEAGSYKLLLQTAGTNKLFELSYNRTENREMLVPLFRALVPVEITGSQPRLVQPQVESFLTKYTDDTYKIYNIEIQEPYIEINGFREILVNNEKSIMEVVGYTNQQPNTKIQLTIDYNVKINKSDKYKPVDVIVEDTGAGNLRTYHGYITIYKSDISPGDHGITATSSSGAFSTIPFYIMESIKPIVTTVYYTYIDGHPYIPTPTPITIIERPTPVVVRVTQTIFVPVTPSQESVNDAQWKAISYIAWVTVAIIIGCIIAGYIAAAYIRSRKKGGGNNGNDE